MTKGCPQPADWIDAEPGTGTSLARIGGALLRGWSRPVRTVAIALVMAAAVGYVAARERPEPARVVVRLSETPLSERGMVLGRADLRHWVEDAALSSERLWQVIERHDLYPRQRALGRDAAIEALREDMQLDVDANYFLVDRGGSGGQLRSARIAIRFTDADRELAEKVALSLARTVIDFQIHERQARTAAALAVVERQLADAGRLIDQRGAELARAVGRFDRTARGRASARVAVDRLVWSAQAGTALYKQVAAERSRLALRLQAEERQLAQRLEIASVERPRAPRLGSIERLLGLGGLALVLLLPLTALTVGAFDNRVRSRADLTDLGLAVLAAVPRRRRATPIESNDDDKEIS